MRKNQAQKRSVLPDPVYNSQTVTKAINKIMLNGKKGLAQTILYRAFDMVKAKTKQEPLEVFRRALDNVIPVLELKFRKIGGANYQIPVEVTENRKEALALRWLVNYARNRHEKTMTERLACEIIDASNNTGASVKKKEDTHKMAEANRAFAHYR